MHIVVLTYDNQMIWELLEIRFQAKPLEIHENGIQIWDSGICLLDSRPPHREDHFAYIDGQDPMDCWKFIRELSSDRLKGLTLGDVQCTKRIESTKGNLKGSQNFWLSNRVIYSRLVMLHAMIPFIVCFEHPCSGTLCQNGNEEFRLKIQ